MHVLISKTNASTLLLLNIGQVSAAVQGTCRQPTAGVMLLNRRGVCQRRPGKGLEFNALCLQIRAAVSRVFKVDLIPCRLQRAEPGNVKRGSSETSISAQHCVRWIFRLSLISTDAVSPSCGVTDTGD